MLFPNKTNRKNVEVALCPITGGGGGGGVTRLHGASGKKRVDRENMNVDLFRSGM